MEHDHGTRREACFACPVHCHAAYAVKDGKYPTRGGGPEYETTTALGHKCDITDDKAVLKLNAMCTTTGWTRWKPGAMFSTLMELMERKIIDKEFVDGIDIQFSNGDACVELMPLIVFRQGCGDKMPTDHGASPRRSEKRPCSPCITKKACVRPASRPGPPSVPCFNSRYPRAARTTSTACPRRNGSTSLPWAVKVAGYKEAGDVRSYHPQAKARLVQYYENMFFLSDSLGICKFNFGHPGYWHDRAEDLDHMYDLICKSIYYASGIKYTVDDLFRIFERSNQIERATIVMRGIRRKDDQPNWKCLHESCPGEHPVGPIPLPPIDSKKYNKILTAYYKQRGWDEDGVPKPQP